MANLVSTLSEVIENIHGFDEDIERFGDIISYFRHWYAIRQADGTWLFGPSKFIGYAGMTSNIYFGRPYDSERHGRVNPRDKDESPLDGRVTELALAEWSEPIEEGHPLFEALTTALNVLCGQFGKKPNKRTRISIIGADADLARSALNDDLVALMAAVFKTLTPAQQSAFRKQVVEA